MDNDKNLVDQIPKVVWFGAGWVIQGEIDKDKQAYRDAGKKVPVIYTLFNWFIFLWFAIPAAFFVWVFFLAGE